LLAESLLIPLRLPTDSPRIPPRLAAGYPQIIDGNYSAPYAVLIFRWRCAAFRRGVGDYSPSYRRIIRRSGASKNIRQRILFSGDDISP